MTNAVIHWDDPAAPAGNVAHIASNGLTPDEVDGVILDPSLPIQTTRTTGRRCKFGWTHTGKYIIAVWEVVDPVTPIVYPVTAYEVPPPTGP